MRALLVLVSLSLVAAGTAVANHDGRPFGCDYDDDLYNHCHVGTVHWVTGPWCVGVDLKDDAECVDLRRLLA